MIIYRDLARVSRILFLTVLLKPANLRSYQDLPWSTVRGRCPNFTLLALVRTNGSYGQVPNVTKIYSLRVPSEPHLIHLSENYKFQQTFFSIFSRHHSQTVY